MNETEIRRLLDTVPVERRMQVRAAVTGSADELIRRLRQIVAQEGWQAALSGMFMAEAAARHRTPEEVAALAVSLRAVGLASPVLDAAALARPSAELARVAMELDRLAGEASRPPGRPTDQELGLPELFLRTVAARRLPGDLATMLAALPAGGRPAATLIRLVSTARPDKVAQVVLNLRGLGRSDLADEIAVRVVSSGSSSHIAAFLTWLDHYGDQQTVAGAISFATTWTAPADLGLTTSPAGPGCVDRITELVQALLGDGQRGQAELARLVVTAAVRNFARYREQYRLCALLFVFKQRGLDGEAEQIRAEILAGLAQDDEVSMIIEICKSSETPADVASLLRAILENPQPGVTESAAFRLAQNLESARPDIFAAISLWPYDNLRAFEDRLRDAQSVTWADGFRDTVAECAANRSDAVDLGKIVLWLLFDVPDGRGRALARDPGRERASRLLAKAVQRRRPEQLVTLICVLHNYRKTARQLGWAADTRQRGWWALRAVAAKQVATHYDIDDMVGLVDAGAGRCLPALLRLTPEWLTYGERKDLDIVRLVGALHAALGDRDELRKTLDYSARHFSRADGTTPNAALEAEGLQEEANAWVRGKRAMTPMFKRPDPDPPR